MEPKIIKKNGYMVEIYQDELAENPREWDNLGTLFTAHRRYTLGDEGAADPKEISKDLKALEIPVYLYDHSGLRMATTPFHCPWDSGQVGVIYVTKETLRKEFSIKRVLAKHIEQARTILKGEIEIMDQYLTGDVYGYHVYGPKEEGLDGCGGFYGYEYAEKAAVEALESFCYDATEEKALALATTANVPSRGTERFWRMNNAPA